MSVERCPHCGGLLDIRVQFSVAIEPRAVTRQVTSRPAPAFAVGDRVRVVQHTNQAVEGATGTVVKVFHGRGGEVTSVHAAIPGTEAATLSGTENVWPLRTWQVERVDADG